MRGRLLAVSAALLLFAVACSSFGTTPSPEPDASAPIDAHVPPIEDAAIEAAPPTCADPTVGIAETRFESKHGPVHALKTDSVHLYVAGAKGIERANAAGDVGYIAILEDQEINDIATSTKALFYVTGGNARYRTHDNFVQTCAGDCQIAPGYQRLFGDGRGDNAIGAQKLDSGGLSLNRLIFLRHTEPRDSVMREDFMLENAAAGPDVSVVTGKIVNESANKTFRVPEDGDGGALPIAPVQMVSDGKMLYFTEGDGSVNAFDLVARTKITLVTGQSTPSQNAVLTGTHFWFGTQAGIRRIRLSDKCVQKVTNALTGPFVVVGTKLVTIDGAKILMSDVSD